MVKTLNLTESAQKDLDDSYQWYENQSQGLGKEFIRCVDAQLAMISRNPLQCPVIFNKYIRRTLTNRFPYSIYFIDEDDLITVFAILHQRRNPETWQDRV